MARPLIALLTDFGLHDHYVGSMKGVVLGICPDAALVDLSHDIAAHDIAAGARMLDAAYRDFPVGTIFLVIVDPGVGSTRRALAVDTGTYRLVGPDNGVLSPVFAETPEAHVVELTNPVYARATISRTFEGRDRFAPAAAWLAAGTALSQLGPSVDDAHRLPLSLPVRRAGAIDGDVVHIDRFGNLITNIDETWVAGIPANASIEIGGHRIEGIVATYADVSPGTPCALMGSSRRLEIAVNGASASSALATGRGGTVRVRWTA
jgi:S-adenosylmethionine hydrolase